MVEAEEGSRIKAGAAIRPSAGVTTAARNRDTPDASHANGIDSTQFCQNVYSKPAALFSVNACRTSSRHANDIRHWLIGRAMVWMSRTN
jgi:hypothetical protein